MEDTALVRFNKRRKIHRRREDEDDSNMASEIADSATRSSHHDELHGTDSNAQVAETEAIRSPPPDTGYTGELSVAELLRRRRQAKARRGGIEFSNSASVARFGRSDGVLGRQIQTMNAPSATEDTPNVLEMAQSRFAPQTGAVSESNNQHMTSFIDSEMARLRAGTSSAANNNDNTTQTTGDTMAPINVPNRQPAALGQIQEIDLGPDAAMRNIAMTEAATRRLQSGQSLEGEEAMPQKVRLGRDGKPRRPRKRRGSDDVKRDEVVEAVLRENRLDLYDESNNRQPGLADDPDAADAADDIIAEQFQRDFLEAIQSRNRMRKPPAQAPAGKKGALEEKSRGPKLGGSRSARAAMHAAEKAKTGKK